MTPQELKNSILQLAIQGRLVEQRPEEGTAAELLEKILAAKKNLTRSRGACGEKKTSATSAPPREKNPDDEKPFDIPESWEWVRLGEVVFNHGQKTPSEDFSYIDIGSIDNKNQRLSKTETIIHASDASPRARKIVQKGDVLYATVRPYLHNVCIIDHDFSHEPIASTGFAVMACMNCLDNKFLFHFLLSPDFDRYANSSENAKGVAYPAISDKRLYNAPIHLPPLAEQKRIVAKIEELLPLIDRYEKAWSRLEDFNKRFPVDMQKSLLQLAIQGKLVEQRTEEGTAAELLEKILAAKKNLTRSRGARGEKAASALSAFPREAISDDENPFDIPESWEWVRLKDIGDIVTGATPNKSESDLYGGQYPFYKPAELDQGYNVIHAKETLSDVGWSKARRLSVGSVLVTCIGATIGKTGIIRREGSCNQQINAIIPYEVVSEYLYYVIISAWFQSSLKADASRTTLPIMNKRKFENLLVPLPPLAEQKRIVAKLEELLPLCERLK